MEEEIKSDITKLLNKYNDSTTNDQLKDLIIKFYTGCIMFRIKQENSRKTRKYVFALNIIAVILSLIAIIINRI